MHRRLSVSWQLLRATASRSRLARLARLSAGADGQRVCRTARACSFTSGWRGFRGERRYASRARFSTVAWTRRSTCFPGEPERSGGRGIDSLPFGDAVERAVAGDREDGRGGGTDEAVSRRSITSTDGRATASMDWNCGRRTACNWRVQGIVLRENGYRCDEGVAYYAKHGSGCGCRSTTRLIAETEAGDRCGLGAGAARARFLLRWSIRRSVRVVRWSGSACRMRRTRFVRGRTSGAAAAWAFDRRRRKPARNRPPVRCGSWYAAERTAAAVSEFAGLSRGKVRRRCCR